MIDRKVRRAWVQLPRARLGVTSFAPALDMLCGSLITFCGD